ncbi:unnamed protein product [Calypogeia fissa]
MHLTPTSDITRFIREWDQLKAQGRTLTELLDEKVLAEVLKESPQIRDQLQSTVEIDRHKGEFKGFTFDLETIAQIIWTGDLPNLRIIDLSHDYNDLQGEVGVKGAKALGRALRSGKVPCLKTLDLWGNPIEDRGVVAIAHALESGRLTSLKRLAVGPFRIEDDMFWEGAAISESLEALARALASGHAPMLEHLSLYRVLRGDEGVRLLMSGIRAGGVLGLRRLHLQGSEFVSRIGTQGMRAIAESSFFSFLIELNLSGNRIEDDGVLALIKAFKTTRMGYLEVLDLDRNTMSDKVLVELAKLLEAERYLPKLRTLRLGPTQLTVNSARAFGAAYQRNKTLTVDVTHLDWPTAALRDTADRFRYRNWRAAEGQTDEIRKEANALLKVKIMTSSRIPSCFGLSTQKWGKLQS